MRDMRPPGRADACAACAHMHVESVLEETELPERIADDREELLVTRLLPAATPAGAVVVPGAVTLDPLRRNVALTGCPGQARPAGRRHVRADLDHRGARSRVRRRNDVSGGAPQVSPIRERHDSDRGSIG
jgi:hypothetical protein